MTDPYPNSDPCPFCAITAANPFPSATDAASTPATLWTPASSQQRACLAAAVPSEVEVAERKDRTDPASYVVLRSEDVVAFLDILPMTRGHLLVCSRGHRGKVQDLRARESREVGFWLPILARTVAKVTGVTDYNIVQNNGARAAQVVPHVHFHIIPRPGSMPEIKNKSWTMFGRGQRDELDEDEGARIAREMRGVLRGEVEGLDLEGEGGAGVSGGVGAARARL